MRKIALREIVKSTKAYKFSHDTLMIKTELHTCGTILMPFKLSGCKTMPTRFRLSGFKRNRITLRGFRSMYGHITLGYTARKV